ncbi:hypothetical protein EV359DRAFT_64873 [Lentinula novae-zelandiae]|nr:hypothetical protein EV359DRAFT_64873 [Lentinula novae-zelandiae]
MAIGYVSAIRNLEVIKFTNLAAGTVIIYDHLLTLNDEKNSWSMGKALFIINRYYSLIATIVINNYGVFDISTGRDNFTNAIICNHSKSRSSGGRRIQECHSLIPPEAYKDTETLLCVPLLPTFSYSFWIPRLAFETVLCILALIRGFQLHKDEIGETDWSGNDLMRILIRDSIGYYIVMFAIYLMCLVVWITNIDLAGISFGISVAFFKRDQLSTSMARGVEADLLYAPSVE